MAVSAPTNADVQAALNTIPALTGNVTVTGPGNGPYTVTFGGRLTGLDVSQHGEEAYVHAGGSTELPAAAVDVPAGAVVAAPSPAIS